MTNRYRSTVAIGFALLLGIVSVLLNTPGAHAANRMKIGIVVFDGFATSEVTAPFEVFGRAAKEPEFQGYDVVTVASGKQEVISAEGLHIVPQLTFENCPQLAVIIVPSAPDSAAAGVVAFIEKQAPGATYVASHCAGAFLLAKAGVLKDHKATTYRGGEAKLQALFPDVKVQDDQHVVTDRNVITSNGTLISYEASLRLLEQLTNSEFAQKVGKSIAAISGQDSLLAEELAGALAGGNQSVPAPVAVAVATNSGAGTIRLIDLSVDGLFSAGFSTVNEDEIRVLHGGGHDPKQNGFTVQNVELSFLGAVDPYLRAESHIVFQLDEQGATGVELEEAFLTTQTLPHGLQLKAGQFFTEVGRLNQQHPHAWYFADQPVISSRMFGGDGLRGPGIRLSWLTPLPYYSELLFTVQNARGETQFSFLSTSAELAFSGVPFVARKVDGPEDMLYALRSFNSVSLSEATTLNLGSSAVLGPNASGADARTTILGADAFLRWQRPVSYQGYPFVNWQSEALFRSYEAGPTPISGGAIPRTTLHDWGFYSLLVWGYRRGWVGGVRIDYANGDGNAGDPLRDGRLRLSANLTHYPTEFSKIRLQYNADRAQHLNDKPAHSVWVQFEFLIGAHGAHKF